MSGPPASSLYAQALHANGFRAHVAHGRIESGVLALLRRRAHELRQPESGADELDPAKVALANQLQAVTERLLEQPGDIAAWALLRDNFSGEASGIRPGVLSAILASMLQVEDEPAPVAAAAAAGAEGPTDTNWISGGSNSGSGSTPAASPHDAFLPTYVRRTSYTLSAEGVVGGGGGGGGGGAGVQQPGGLSRARTYHAVQGSNPTSLFGQALALFRGEQGEAGVLSLLKTRAAELAQRHSAEERAQAYELRAAMERLGADASSAAAWHTLSAGHFAAPNTGISSTMFSMQLSQPIAGGGAGEGNGGVSGGGEGAGSSSSSSGSSSSSSASGWSGLLSVPEARPSLSDWQAGSSWKPSQPSNNHGYSSFEGQR